MLHRAMLACDVDLEKIRYPVWGSAKVDGIRAIPQMSRVYSRKLIAFPNVRLQREYSHALFDQVDGEMAALEPNHPDLPGATFSVMMSKSSEAPLNFHVFDLVGQGMMPYEERYELLYRRVRQINDIFEANRVFLHPYQLLRNLEELIAYEDEILEDGYEGIIVRQSQVAYKSGRRTMNGQQLMKLKRFEDAEAVIIGFEEMMRNDNPATLDAQGLTKRSSNIANKTPAGMLGKFWVRDLVTGKEFKLSGRITTEQRKVWWAIRDQLLGKFVTYRHFTKSGVKNLPRKATFKCFRDPMDF